MYKVLVVVAALAAVGCGDKNNSPSGDAGNDTSTNFDMGMGDVSDAPDAAADLGQDAGSDMGEVPTVLHEMIFDDDVADFPFIPLTADGFVTGTVVAQRFEPPVDGTLQSARIVIANGGTPTGAFEVMVYAADGPDGNPGTELLDSALLAQADAPPEFGHDASVTWADVDFSELNIPVSQDGFYVGVRYAASSEQTTPALALDLHSAENQDRARILLPGEDWARFIDALPDEIDSVPMIRATVALPEAEAPTPISMLSNAPRDCRRYIRGSNQPAYVQTWSAARLIPEQTPFEVRRVRYELGDGPNQAPTFDCDAKLAHRVWVFVGGETPDASPQPVESFDVQLDDTERISFITPVELELTQPLRLDDGDVLYVAVELLGDNPEVCVAVCADNYQLEHNWMTDGLEPPFEWLNHDVFGDAGRWDVTHRAYGQVVE